ncbi:tetraspanin-19 [Ornithorhynchus anatinus]|uniref:Tetraspanin n=1 Tax=Ornithorhynchus anatinus TaxID=9258 RepID=A0A6I8P732_ORNAN|nr:tetraspanin-19 [Ornithorhynchus anatinus]
MRRKDKILFLKHFLCIFNGTFLILGLLVAGFGIWLLLDRGNLVNVLFSTGKHSCLIAKISRVLIGTGSAIVLAAFLGYLAILREIKCFVILYVVFVILACGLQIGLSGLIFIKKEEVKHIMYDSFDSMITDYGSKDLPQDRFKWDILNMVQNTFTCCGRSGSKDWQKNKNKENANQIPCSCMKLRENTTERKWFCDALKNATHTKGCEEDINIWFEYNTLTLIGINFGLLTSEIFLLVLSLSFFRNIKNKIYAEKNYGM